MYEDNLDILKEDIETYKESNRLEEIFVRAGTEISTLPESLENIYTEIFVDQDKIVDFYNEYIVVFREIKAEMSELAVEMELLKSEIETKTEEYEKQYNQLEAGIISFNSCAEIVGCFESDSAFYAKRNQLLLEKETLNLLNEEINELINKYNKKVELYNADVTESYKLQDIINSNKKVEEI